MRLGERARADVGGVEEAVADVEDGAEEELAGLVAGLGGEAEARRAVGGPEPREAAADAGRRLADVLDAVGGGADLAGDLERAQGIRPVAVEVGAPGGRAERGPRGRVAVLGQDAVARGGLADDLGG